MIEITFQFPDCAAAIRALTLLGESGHEVTITPVEQPDKQPEKPRRTRKTAPETVAIEPAAVASVPVDLFASNAPTTQAVPEPAKQPEQKDLIAALRAAYDKKADSAIAIVAHFGVKSVGQIPKDRWAEAIAMANKAAA